MADCEFTWEDQGDQIVIRAPLARITMVRTGGQWTHHLDIFHHVFDPSIRTPLISAIEMDPNLGDPARIVSPGYQEIQRHEFAGDQIQGICLLMTGHLFQHHFSAAVSLFRDPADTRRMVLEFDIADRCRAPVVALAATYQVRLDGTSMSQTSPSALSWRLSDPGAEASDLELSCLPPGSLAVAESRSGVTQVQALASLDPNSFTHRLRYQWRWTGVH